eukprot:752273-Hanusia_phi.AAC.5
MFRHTQNVRGNEASRSRKLTAELAIRIFMERSSHNNSKFVESELVARNYGVSSKTVRDIWDRRSWAVHTTSLVARQKAVDVDRERTPSSSRAEQLEGDEQGEICEEIEGSSSSCKSVAETCTAHSKATETSPFGHGGGAKGEEDNDSSEMEL